MEQRVCFKGDSQRIGHSLQGADYSLQLRGKLQTARLAGHQPQANPFGLDNLQIPLPIKEASVLCDNVSVSRGVHKVIGHSLQGADYSLQLRGKLQTARLAGHQPQANPFGLQTFNKRKNGSCPGPCVTTPSDCLRQTTSVFFEGHDWSIYNKDQSEKGPHTTQ